MALAQAGAHRSKNARGDVTSNSVEAYFNVFERGMVGICPHATEQHLKRDLAEFDFKQSHRAKLGINDTMRAELMLQGADVSNATIVPPPVRYEQTRLRNVRERLRVPLEPIEVSIR